MTVSSSVDLHSLIDKYERHRPHYRSGHYNEAQLRVEFVDQLFIALGWDVRNDAGYADAYKDVIHEDAIKIGTATKAPDYAFRVGGVRKFFLETKKPSVDITRDPEPASTARTDQDRQHLDRLIAATDTQIDQLVYELYDLTDEEIAIVEGEVG